MRATRCLRKIGSSLSDSPVHMNSSLRDQLLAAGLVTEKQARQAAQEEQQRQFRTRSRTNARPPTPAAQNAGKPRGQSQPAATVTQQAATVTQPPASVVQ